jgi:hypothetical protein
MLQPCCKSRLEPKRRRRNVGLGPVSDSRPAIIKNRSAAVPIVRVEIHDELADIHHQIEPADRKELCADGCHSAAIAIRIASAKGLCVS